MSKKVTVERVNEIATGIIEEYRLDYGNSEIDEFFIYVEGPDHSTVQVNLSEINENGSKLIRTSFLKRIIEAIDGFDPDDEFERLWSPSFGKHNSFSAREFLKILDRDEEFFQSVIEKMEEEIKETSEAIDELDSWMTDNDIELSDDIHLVRETSANCWSIEAVIFDDVSSAVLDVLDGEEHLINFIDKVANSVSEKEPLTNLLDFVYEDMAVELSDGRIVVFK